MAAELNAVLHATSSTGMKVLGENTMNGIILTTKSANRWWQRLFHPHQLEKGKYWLGARRHWQLAIFLTKCHSTHPCFTYFFGEDGDLNTAGTLNKSPGAWRMTNFLVILREVYQVQEGSHRTCIHTVPRNMRAMHLIGSKVEGHRSTCKAFRSRWT